MEEVNIFTDGSCFNNGKKNAKAGMGVHFPNGELEDLSVPFTIGVSTNQRAELGAIYLALKYWKQNFEPIVRKKVLINIYTDSNYSIKCLTEYIHKWEKNGWLTSKKEKVLNQDLLKAIYKYMRIYKITFTHVYSHTNSKDYNSVHNSIADKLATSASEEQNN